MLTLLLLLHALVALLAITAGRRLRRGVLLLGVVAPAATLLWLSATAGSVLGGGSRAERVEWLPALGLAFDLRLDGFTLLIAMLVSGIGTAIFIYSRWYFGDGRDLGGFVALMTAFAGSMLGVVFADNLLVLYVFWELTSVTSYLLIGFDHEKAASRAAALQAILVTAGGGLAMLAGFVLIGQAAGTYSISSIVATPPAGPAIPAAGALVLFGAMTKSAQVPFHSWLAGAMAAPTPVSAYLHSATLVKAGVYLVGRLAPVLAPMITWWRPLLVAVGATTMLVAGYRSLRQHDLKLLLAFGTISQLGFMILLLGAGDPELTFAGAALILAHGLFKATLFMVVGIIDHETGTRDLRRLNGLGARSKPLLVVATVAVASMVGLPTLVGFLAKEAALEALLHSGGFIATAAVVAGSILTFAYGARFLWGAFATKAEVVADDDGVHVHTDEHLPGGFLAPAAVLAGITVVLGVLPAAGTVLIRAAARSVDLRVTEPKLALWHGFTTALLLSVVTFIGGSLLFVKRREVEGLQERVKVLPSAQGIYVSSLRGLNRIADRTTGTLQNGSLPIYVGVILLTVLALPGSVLIARNSIPPAAGFASSPLQVMVAAAVLAASLATAVAKRRLVAVLLLGAVGFGVAVLFVLHGAPDLALTQLLVETLLLVIFVLVLRHLPQEFEPARWRVGKVLQVGVATAIGAFVAIFALVTAGARTSEGISTELVARALPEGGGRNVVNVILTDFRAFDTLGEITVIAVATLGIAGLASASRGAPRRNEEEGR